MIDFENEQQSNSDVSPVESSSETPQSASGEGMEAAQAEASPKEQPTDTNVPFHQHPRWIERDNELKSERQARQALEQQIKEIQGNLARQQQAAVPTTQKEQDALLARLKGIDPEFGERFEKLDQTRSELQELRQWKQEIEAQNLRQQAVSTVNGLHEQNKVAAEDRDIYNQILQARVASMPNARLEDLPNIYKDVHEMFSKRYEALRRSERESYVKGKTQDAKSPASQPKGKAAPTATGEEWSSDPETARQQAVSRIVKQMKASQDI